MFTSRFRTCDAGYLNGLYKVSWQAQLLPYEMLTLQ